MNQQYDVLVVGGGLAGALVALKCARAKKRTMLTDHRGCLCWEVTRAGRLFTGENSLKPQILRELETFGAYKDGILNPPGLEVFFEQELLDAGGEILYYLWPLHYSGHAEWAEVVFATKHGRIRVSAKTIVDCTQQGTLLQQLTPKPRKKPSVKTIQHALLLGGGEVPETCNLPVEDLPLGIDSVSLRAAGKTGLMHGDLSLAVTELGRLESLVCGSLVPLRQYLKEKAGFNDCLIAHVYEESWILYDSWLTDAAACGVAEEYACFAVAPYLNRFQQLAKTNGKVIALVEIGEEVGSQIAVL